MPLVFPSGPFIELGGHLWFPGGPGGRPVALEDFIQGGVITAAGIPRVDASTTYWALAADIVAEGNTAIAAVNAAKDALHAQIAALPLPSPAVLQAINANLQALDTQLFEILQTLTAGLNALPQVLAAQLAPLLEQSEQQVLASIEASRDENLTLHEQLVAFLAPAVTKIAELEPVTPTQLGEQLDEARRLITESVGAALGVVTGDVGSGLDAIRFALELLLGMTTRVGEQPLTEVASMVGSVRRGMADDLAVPLRGIVERLTQLLAQQLGPDPSGVAAPINKLGTDVTAELTKFTEDTGELAAQLSNKGVDLDAVLRQPELALGGAWPVLLTKLWRLVPALLWGTAPIYGPALAQEALEHFPGLAQRFQALGLEYGERIVHGIDVLHGPMKAVMRTGSDLFFQELENQLAGLGQSDPDTVLPMASQLLTTAAGLGMSAHLIATVAEKIHGTKNLGFGQLAAFLVDLAGFEGIARNSFGVQFEAALRSPALRRANNRFRPELPDSGRFDQLFLERLVSEGDAARFYAERGWTDGMINAHLTAVFKEPSPRELAMVFEDGEIDDTWGFRMLQQAGFEDDDAGRLLKGVITRAKKSVRQGVIGEVLSNYTQGIYDDAEAAALLREVPLSPDAVQEHMAIGRQRRLRREMEEHSRILEEAVVAGSITDDDLVASLATLGYDAREQGAARARARLRLGVRLFREEQADEKALIRRAQTDSINAATEAFRRFKIDEGGLRSALVHAGVAAKEVDSLIDLAVIRRAPVPKLPELLTDERQAQDELELAKRAILELQAQKVIDEATSAARQRQIGLPPREAEFEARLVAARLARPPDVAKPPTPTEVELERRRAKTDAAIELFRGGALTVEALVAQLKAAGNDDKVAAALAAREDTRRKTQVVRAVAEENARQLERQRDELERAAVFAFREGRFSEADLLQNLVGIGRPFATAQAIVEREKARRSLEEERKAARGPAA